VTDPLPTPPDGRPRLDYDALFARHLPDLEVYVRRRVDGLVLARESVSDLVQSVCREVIEHEGRFRHDEEEGFRRWLFRTAERKIIDRHRYYTADRRAASREETPSAASPLPADATTPSEGARGREELERIARALARLPEDAREVIRLHRFEDLGHAEIAIRLGRTVGATRNLLYRGLVELSALLLESEEKDGTCDATDEPVRGDGRPSERRQAGVRGPRTRAGAAPPRGSSHQCYDDWPRGRRTSMGSQPSPASSLPFVVGAVLTLAAGVAAQATFMTLNSTTPGRYGADVASIGDLDDDGFADLIVGGAPLTGSLPGFVEVRSGRDAHKLLAVVAPIDGSDFGTRVADAGDVDGDGVPDVLVGARLADVTALNAGAAFVFSGADGSTLHTVTGSAQGEQFGYAVSGFRDYDGDGHDDFAVGVPFADDRHPNAGRVEIISGCTGLPLEIRVGTEENQNLGWSLARVGDVNLDDAVDLIVGAPKSDYTAPDAGSAVVLSGRDLSHLLVFEGERGRDWLGYSVGGGGDFTGDGVPDLLVGAPLDDDGGRDAGSAFLFSGADGALVRRFNGKSPGERLGSYVALAGDVDLDGRADALVGSLTTTRLFSPGKGGALFEMENESPQLVQASSGVTDLDRDGHADVVSSPPVRVVSGKVPSLGPTHPYGGRRVDGPGDLDGDGAPDFIVGDVDMAWMISGADGSIINQLVGPPGSSFGIAVAIVGDLDGDGLDEVAVGSRRENVGGVGIDVGRVRLFRASDGQLLRTWTGEAAGDQFGSTVAGIGDANDDGFDDLIVGAVFSNAGGADSGKAYVFSGLDGALLWSRAGDGPGEQMSAGVTGVGDMDDDGYADFAVGAPQPPPAVGPGYVRVYSGCDGSVLDTYTGDTNRDRFGRSVLGIGDLDGDDVWEVLVGAPLADPQGASSGKAYVYCGATGERMFTQLGLELQNRFGRDLGRMGDLDGDGTPDFAIGALDAKGKGFETGFVRIFSGRDARVLAMIEGDSTFDKMGRCVTGLGDVDGDGAPEFVVGSPNDDQQTRIYSFDLPPYPWSDMGASLAGLRGLPRLVGQGHPSPGRLVELVLSAARKDSAVVLLQGLNVAYDPFFGGVLVPSPLVQVDMLVTDAFGHLTHGFAWPSVPTDTPIYFQMWIADAAGPEGFASSNGLVATTQESAVP